MRPQQLLVAVTGAGLGDARGVRKSAGASFFATSEGLLFRLHKAKGGTSSPRGKRGQLGVCVMSYEDRGLVSLVEQIKQASANIADGDARMNQRIDGIETSVNELLKRANRPGASWRRRTTTPSSARRRLVFVRTGAP